MLPVTQGSEASSSQKKNDEDGIENSAAEEQEADYDIQPNQYEQLSLEIICVWDACINCEIHCLKNCKE